MKRLTKRLRSKPFVQGFFSPKEAEARPRREFAKLHVKPLDERLPTKTLESVMSILVSVQWDRWRFMLPAKPLLKLDVAIVSHGHLDHWGTNFPQKDFVLVPEKVRIPKCFVNLRNLLKVEKLEAFKGLSFTLLERRALSSFLRYPVQPPHAYWWLATYLGTCVLFVGDANMADVETLHKFAVRALDAGVPLKGVLLPSFGGTTMHGTFAQTELGNAIKELACELASLNMAIGGLPHPIEAPWADFNAVKLESLALP